jgi:hypothetical protein
VLQTHVQVFLTATRICSAFGPVEASFTSSQRPKAEFDDSDALPRRKRGPRDPCGGGGVTPSSKADLRAPPSGRSPQIFRLLGLESILSIQGRRHSKSVRTPEVSIRRMWSTHRPGLGQYRENGGRRPPETTVSSPSA